MRIAMQSLRWLIRACAVVQITLGLLFWSGNAFSLVQVHMLTGLLLVLGLWAQAVLGARSGVPYALSALAIVWGLVVVALGVTQLSILPEVRPTAAGGINRLVGRTSSNLLPRTVAA